MKSVLKAAFFIAAQVYFVAFAQELPPIQNFSAAEYKAQNQNWGISQDEKKVVYIANNEGLLEYNGAKWNLYPSPNKTIMRSVQVIGARIFTGCYMEFGYWERNEFGILHYTSLSKSIGLKLKEDEEFWRIFSFDNLILFQSLQSIYIHDIDEGSTKRIDAKNEIVHMFNVGESILYQERNHGIFQIYNGEGTLLADQNAVKTDDVVNIFAQEDGFLLVTRTKGFFSLRNGNLVPWIVKDQRLRNLNIYSCLRTKNNTYLLGTVSHGLIHLSDDGVILNQFNQNNSLLNNTVLSIFEDVDGNFWAGLDNGVSLINSNAPIKFFQDNDGTLGSVYASSLYRNKIYLGTNQGLFCKDLSSDQPLRFVAGTEGQVWSLRIINGELFCGHQDGTFIIKEGKAIKVAAVQGTWKLEAIDEKTILQGNYDGLYVLERDPIQWRLRNKIEGFKNSSRHFATDKNKILVNHEYKGVFHLQVDSSFRKVQRVEMDTILKSANSSITKFREEILYGYQGGILSFDPDVNRFQRDSTLSSVYGVRNYLSGNVVRTGKPDEFWLFLRDRMSRISFDNLVDRPRFTDVPLSYNSRQEIIEFENVTHMYESTYLIGSSSGYFTIDLNKLTVSEFSVQLSSIGNGINLDHSFSSNLVRKDLAAKFASDENNFSFNFHTTSFQTYYNLMYQHRLVGLYDQWSEWASSSSVFYENLPPGKYEFNVRSKVGNMISENIATYEFTIAKPWYTSNLMIVAYFLMVAGFSVFMHNVYRTYYKRQQRELIEKNQNELELAHLQREKEVMELKNEQLEKENKSKSNELAASTMSIIKKNELLNQIKEQLSKVGDSKIIKPVIKTIDQNLNQRKNWELFKEAFNSADRDFFKNLTDVHPDLSPNDLKLCAYLRLNLSSKEIAGLINISPRSVEVKRYRLRKKLGLDNNENLANYIINI